MADKKLRFNHVSIGELYLDRIKKKELYVYIQDAVIKIKSDSTKIDTHKGTKRKGLQHTMEEIVNEYKDYHIVIKDRRTVKDDFVIDLNDTLEYIG